MRSFITLALSAVLLVASALPTCDDSTHAFDGSVVVPAITVAQVLVAAPRAAACTDSTATLEGCATAPDAAKYLAQGFATYGMNKLAQQAALLSLMTFESGDFVYNINMFPGRPGQGTRSMMNFKFIYEYALGFPELRPGVLADNGGKLLDVNGDLSLASNATQKAVLKLVLPNNYSFGSAPWFVKSQCPTIAEVLAKNGHAGFSEYITKCVGTELTKDRDAKWCLALKALKPADMEMPTECA